MTSSTSGIIPDGKRRKGGNQARPQPKKVKGGRVSKQRNKSPHRWVSLQEIQNSPNNVRRNIQLKGSTLEIVTSSEDNAYEHVGTDQDCSEGSGSPTDQDTPTRLALAKRRKTKGKQREKITHAGWRARRAWQEQKTTRLASVSHRRSNAAHHVLNVSKLMPDVIRLPRQPNLLYRFRLLAICDFSRSSLFQATETRKQAARVSTHHALGRIQ